MSEQTHQRPPMPEERPFITCAAGNLKLTLMSDPARYSSGFVAMRFYDCCANIMRGDEQIGEVAGAIGGNIVVTVGERTWSIDPLDLFELVQKAEKRFYLK